MNNPIDRRTVIKTIGAAAIAPTALISAKRSEEVIAPMTSGKTHFGKELGKEPLFLKDNCINNLLERSIKNKLTSLDKWKNYVLGFDADLAREYACAFANQANYDFFPRDSTPLPPEKLKLGILMKMIHRLKTPSMVSFQTLESPNDLVFQRRFDGTADMAVMNSFQRKMRALLSYEAVKDLMHHHGIGALEELYEVISMELALEIDREVINDLCSNSAETKNITRQPGDKFFRAVIAEINATKERIAAKQKWSKDEYKKAENATAWAIMSPESNALFAASRVRECSSMPVGTMNIGIEVSPFEYFGDDPNIPRKINILVDPLMPTNRICVGYKFNNFNSGYVYSLFIPPQPSTISLSEDLVPRKNFEMRYCKKMLSPEYYTTINIDGESL